MAGTGNWSPLPMNTQPVRDYLLGLQARIVQALQAEDGKPFASDGWTRLIEQTNVMAGFDLQLQSDPYLPTDTAQLYQGGVPVVSFFTGTHDDYHRPSDSAEKLNYEGLQRIADFATRFTMKIGALETAPEYVKVREDFNAALTTLQDTICAIRSSARRS